MLREPNSHNGRYEKAGSLLYFAIAIVIILFGAALEQVRHVAPVQISGSGLLLVLLALMLLGAYSLRERLH